ncbi:hypothetical protein Sta7437_0073 [Stanieria cyanosphaera PCC 7437]|uniref:Uncharacterized protein n=1 Tax=Stanieria cyanosphaera (strain ATCC 29371 / PCC 7437) TaxID=111780 RepID=K9XM66_STAC7|nr:hypothetical protein [Stanieria cyanosphaera]AFZ33695.1 hypothetical protein Sta7437_0073 [Stanieria cyanosphaera PCC 7437]
MNNKKIPDIETRKKSLSRLREVCLMLDVLNMTLDEAIASAEADLRNNNINRRRRQEAERLFADYKKNN